MAYSPRRRIRLATVADGLKDCLNPVGSTHLRQLDTCNGCQDHTLLPYAASRLRLWLRRARPVLAPGFIRVLAPVVCTLCPLTDQGLPCQHHHAPDAAASTASRPTFATMANAPLPGRDGEDVPVIWGWRQAEFLKIGNFGWLPRHRIRVARKSNATSGYCVALTPQGRFYLAASMRSPIFFSL
jgi:hypothetical protein